MAVTIYEEIIATTTWDWASAIGADGAEQVSAEVIPYPGWSGTLGSSYVNKVWDTVAGAWVRWITEFEDVGGLLYPGPGAFGADTSQYRVEAITFSEFNQ